MGQKPLLIVIDGPAGAGKSTVARRLARHFGVPLLDTGAIYRTLALIAERRDIAWEDEARLSELGRDFPIGFGPIDGDAPPRVWFADEDVTDDIRTAHIGQGASKVSALPGVRRALLDIQRRLGARGCVAEGRDMGTVVFPDAPHKFFLTADLDTRARRRQLDLASVGAPAALDEVRSDIEERDRRDASRAAAPLVQAADALLVDTSGLAIDEVVAQIVAHVERARDR